MGFQIATYFKLNTNKLQEFHEQIGLKYGAWEEAGWNRMLNDSFRQQIEFALQREARKYEVADIYSSAEVLLQIQREVGVVLKDNVARILGDEYFCGPTFNGAGCPDFTFVVKHVGIPEGVKRRSIRTVRRRLQFRRRRTRCASGSRRLKQS